MTELRIGLIGAGWVTEHHLDGYRELDGLAKVVAIADPNAKAREGRMQAYGIDAGFETAEEMLERMAGKLDAVDVASPREWHVSHVKLAASAGLPVLCQKPLAPDLAAAESLIGALPPDVRLMVHENWRFRPHYRLISEWLKADRIGPVRQVLMRIFTGGLVPGPEGELPALTRQPMLADLERMLMMEVLIHHVDALRYLVGPMHLHAALTGQSCAALKGEDRASLLFSAGPDESAAVTILGDFMAHGREAAQIDQLDIFGRDGAIRLDADGASLFRGTGRIEHVDTDFTANYKASYRETIRYFCEGVLSGNSFKAELADNLKTLRLIQSAYEISGKPGLARSV